VSAVASGCRKLKTLRLAHVSNVTNQSLVAIGIHLCHLLVLDVQGCPHLTQWDVLPPTLVEIDVRNTQLSLISAPSTLRFKNGRRLPPTCRPTLSHCCSVFANSQRWKPEQGVEPAPMWCCRDCGLVEDRNRGFCGACAVRCHAKHDTYLSSLTRFYCDCAFGFGLECDCKALATRLTASPCAGQVNRFADELVEQAIPHVESVPAQDDWAS